MIFKESEANNLKAKAESARHFIEKDWYENTSFLEGKHYVVYDTKSQALRKVRKSKGQVQRTINNIKKYSNAMTRLITNDEPQVSIRSTGFDTLPDEEKESIEVINHLVKEKWRTKNMNTMTWLTVKNSLAHSLSANEFYWDSDAREGLGDISWRKIDVWGLYFDPQGKIDLQSGEFDGDWIINSFQTTREALEADPKYKGEIPQGNQRVVSDVKRSLDDLLYQNSSSDADDAIVVDVWYIREASWEKVKEGKKVIGHRKVEKYINKEMIGGVCIYEEEADLQCGYSIKIFKPEVTDTVLTRPVLSDQIDPNKTIDQVFSSMEEYARTMIHGRILKNDKTKISTISNNSGQVISYKGNREPKEWRMSGIDSSLFSLMDNAERVQQSMAQIGDGTLGGGNSSSGLELGLRKATDLENASEPAGALGRYLALCTKTILKLYVKHLETSMPITYDDNGEEQLKTFISVDAADGKDKATTLIRAFDDIEVKIVPKSAFSDMAFQQDVMQLAQMGAIDQETVVESFMEGKTREVIKRVERAKLEAQGIAGEVEEARQEAQSENEALLNNKKPKEGTKWKSRQAQGASIITNGEFLEDLINSGDSEKSKRRQKT